MPSPLAHTAIGYVIAKVSVNLNDSKLRSQKGIRILLAIIIVSLLPDFDVVPGVLLGNFGKYHNNITHSLFFGLAVSIAIGFIVHRAWNINIWKSITTILISYEMHVVLDFFTNGRGVMLFWPFSSMRFHSKFIIFNGLHWSDGFFSVNHLITLVNEGLFILILIGILSFATRTKINSTRLKVKQQEDEQLT